MCKLSSLPNIGKVLEKLLAEAGIITIDQLREVGTEETFIRIRQKEPTACIHMLYGIEGAVEGIKDKFLDETTKENLRKFYKSLERN